MPGLFVDSGDDDLLEDDEEDYDEEGSAGRDAESVVSGDIPVLGEPLLDMLPQVVGEDGELQRAALTALDQCLTGAWDRHLADECEAPSANPRSLKPLASLLSFADVVTVLKATLGLRCSIRQRLLDRDFDGAAGLLLSRVPFLAGRMVAGIVAEGAAAPAGPRPRGAGGLLLVRLACAAVLQRAAKSADFGSCFAELARRVGPMVGAIEQGSPDHLHASVALSEAVEALAWASGGSGGSHNGKLEAALRSATDVQSLADQCNRTVVNGFVMLRAQRRLADAANPVVVALAASTLAFAALAVHFWAEARGGVWKAFKVSIIGSLVAVPGIKGAVDGVMTSMIKDLEDEMLGSVKEEERVRALPDKGMSAELVMATIEAAAAKDKHHWASGKLSGTVYHGGDDLSKIIASAISKFALSNPLHPSSFPSVRKMDAEIVAMTLSLFNPTAECCGTTTSGGTESILLACLAYRDRARAVRGVTEPEMIIPETAHAAFVKGAHYFGIKPVYVPVDQTTFTVSPDAVRARVTSNTVMIIGSAPSFPQGVVDPIPELAAIAKEADAGLHVDCCLGSYMMPFARSVGGRDIPDFDFSVDGVTSISCDTHKYGFAPKGSSVIMWRNNTWRHHQYFSYTDWTGGIYATATLAGSRPGANLAGTWAVLMHMGRDGYEAAARAIFKGADEVAEGVRNIPGIVQLGSTDHAVVAFAADPDAPGTPVNIYKVSTAMAKRGWELNALQKPACVHLCVTYANAGMAKEFVEDLEECVSRVRKNPEDFKGGAAAMYGSSTAMAPPGMLHEVASLFLDTMYKA
ncbi:hypothetical protein FNF29_03316 [Cafeteria roenbergensis]|uniref:sphinganine-1-phosphate aldolase n=1 Tax=Cafeteria roenbergensis TaxID=33653 RepID=A0A5A8CK01_CAFRO|nr:hypothetical protein FNF29_03316 [Cafeteria roenbergensis]|eukprot:KAA0153128.1 hypothetical protein FNF29_03316 [Cafeteria roenbergensis]